MFPIQEKKEHAHLLGKAGGVIGSDDDGSEQPVDGVYLISTILVPVGAVGSRRETVGFKVSGVGPDQISEPYRVKTLTVTAP